MLYNEIMAITPQTDIYLLKCPIEADNRNQINFANATAQYNYFASLPKLVIDNCTYQRKDNVMRLPYHIDDIINYNYVMYRNEAYGNKWFYAFITDMQYSSDHMTFVTIKTDVFQTWQFDLTYMKSFVEREHVNSDTIGEHTMPEGLELGEYVYNAGLDTTVCSPWNNTYICMQISTGRAEKDSYYMTIPETEIVSGLAQGCRLVAMPYTQAGLATMYSIIGAFDSFGQADAIVSIFLVPATCSTWTSDNIHVVAGTTYDIAIYKPVNSDSPKNTDVSNIPSIGTTLNGYTPKNNKLFTYPYNYLYLTNNIGSDVVYHYEDFINNAPAFKEYMTLEQGGSIYVVPTNSKKFVSSGTGNCWPEGISLGKLPQLSWTSNYYLNWVAQNGTNVVTQTTLDALNWAGSTIGMMLTGGGMQGSGVLSLAGSVANTMQQIRQAKMTPDQAKGNTNSGSITYSARKIGYQFCRMSIRYEYAKAIDDYLTQFGYKVNSLKVPNITGRRYWNYVKTIGANIEGNIPQDDMDEIKELFDRGITIWHDTSHYLDYTQNNTIV